MKFLFNFVIFFLAASAAEAQATAVASETFLATGIIAPMYGYPVGALNGGISPKVGETLQFEYTVGAAPLFFDEGPLAVTAIAYSINGSPFFPDPASYGFVGTDATTGYGFFLYPGNGALIAMDPYQKTMLVYDVSGSGAYANLTSVKEISPTSAPEIDPASAYAALALLFGSITVLRGRELRGSLV